MRRIRNCAALAALALAVWTAQAATPAKKKAPQKGASRPATTATTTGKKPAVASHQVPARTTTTHTASASRGGKKGVAPAPRTTWRNRQMAPGADRYKEIQDALAAKGYLNPQDANGSWSQSSTDALKRFQAEQNLESSGKINSLSLIALGLGPKHEAAPETKVPAAQPDQSGPATGRQ